MKSPMNPVMKLAKKVFSAVIALHLFLGLVSFLCFVPSTAAAQKAPPRQITVYATVTNLRGSFFRQLAERNFQLFEEKAERKITSFSDKAQPMSIGFLIDLSSSMTATLTDERGKYSPEINNGIIDFIRQSDQDNEYFIVTFNEKITILQELTKNYEDLKSVLRNDANFKPYGQTRLNDALYAGLNKISRGKHEKKLLIVVTDAQDNTSLYKSRELRRAVGDANTLIYFIYTSDFSSGGILDSPGKSATAEIARMSGGRLLRAAEKIRAQDAASISDAFLYLSEELRNQYTIKFEPGPADKKNEWNEIHLKLDIPRNETKGLGKLFVRAREGYFSLSDESLGGKLSGQN